MESNYTEMALVAVFTSFSAHGIMSGHMFQQLVQRIPDLINATFSANIATELFQSFSEGGDITMDRFRDLLGAVASYRYPDEEPTVAYAHFLAMNVFRIEDVALLPTSSMTSPLRTPLPELFSSPSSSSGFVGGTYSGTSNSTVTGAYQRRVSSATAQPGAANKLYGGGYSPRPLGGGAGSPGNHYSFSSAMEPSFSPKAAIGIFQQSASESSSAAVEARFRQTSQGSQGLLLSSNFGQSANSNAGEARRWPDAQEMAAAHKLMRALDKVAVRRHTRRLVAAFVTLREYVHRHNAVVAVQESLREAEEARVAAAAAAMKKARDEAAEAVEESGRLAEETARRAEEDRERREAEERVRRESAAVASHAAQLAAAAFDESTKAAHARSTWTVVVGGSLCTLLLLLSLGWALTLAAFTAAADAIGGHCEVVLWVHEYASKVGYPVPEVILDNTVPVEGGIVGSGANALAWHAASGCLHALGLRTPLCVSPDCLSYTMSMLRGGTEGLAEDGCTSMYGCGLDAVAV